jgi:anti-sigma B factor antagonist
MTMQRFTTAARRVGGATHIEVHGELDYATVPSLEQEMDSLMTDGAGPVVLDLRALRFIDVAGLRLAVRLESRAQLHGVSFALVRGPATVQRVFEITGMERFVPAVDDPADAA